MRVGDFRADVVSKWIGERFDGELHDKRIASLSDGVLGVLNSASLAVSTIGLALAQAHGLNAKHATKQVDRLLSNPGIDPGRLFTLWVRQAIGEEQEPVVAMDWTEFDADDQSTLMLSLVTTYGRAQPLLWLTVYKAELTGRRNEFEDVCLTRLKEALPEGVRPTILADRGFGDVRLMEFLAELGFAYVIRFRGDTFVTKANGETRKAAQWVGAGGGARKLTGAKLTREGFEVGASVHVHAKRMKEPWHLAASDGTKSAREIMDLYAKRWTIDIDQAWGLSRFCFREGVSAFDRLRDSPPRRRGRSDRFQGHDHLGSRQDQLGALGGAAGVAARQAALLDPGVEGRLRHPEFFREFTDRPFVRPALDAGRTPAIFDRLRA